MVDLWGNLQQPIALVELAAVVQGTFNVLGQHQEWWGRDAIWFVDNTVALATLTKGNSREPQIAAGVEAVHFALAFMGIRVWFEYVESHANWSDGASRDLLEDKWSRENGFKLELEPIPEWPWIQSSEEVTSKVEAALRATVEEGAAVEEPRPLRAAAAELGAT